MDNMQVRFGTPTVMGEARSVKHSTVQHAEKDRDVIKGGNYLVCRNGGFRNSWDRGVNKGLTKSPLITAGVSQKGIPSSTDDNYLYLIRRCVQKKCP